MDENEYTMRQVLKQAESLVERFFDRKTELWMHAPMIEEHNDAIRVLSTRMYVGARQDNAGDMRACANAIFLLGYEAGLEDRKSLKVWRDQL